LGGLVGALAIPGLSSWDILSRPFGTVHVVVVTQDYVLGYYQPSLRDWFAICVGAFHSP
jgi:hypothetical protein